MSKLKLNTRFEGDKVILLIVTVLMALSLVIVLSSTSLEKGVVRGNSSRFDIFKDQLIGLGLGLSCLVVVYKFFKAEWFKKCGLLALVVSLGVSLLLLQGRFTGWLVDSKDTPRALNIGFSLFVCEVLKVSLLFYLAWAVDRYRNKETKYINRKARTYDEGKFLHKLWNNGTWQRCVLFYAPIVTCCSCVAVGGTSSALILGLLCVIVLFMGVENKHIAKFIGVLGIVVVFLFTLIMTLPRDLLPGRGATIRQRVEQKFSKNEVDFKDLVPNSEEYKTRLKYYKQIDGCMIAIQNGGFVGKGTGNSQQKYVVPVIYADYVFSFFCEEYGFLGAFLLIVLYLTLMARGRIIARGLKQDSFEQMVFAALTIMITLQAFVHIAVNLNMGPTTGQSLPLISYGKSAFVCMCIAFGIILNLSREARKAVQKQIEEAQPIVVHDNHMSDESQDMINDLSDFSNDEII